MLCREPPVSIGLPLSQYGSNFLEGKGYLEELSGLARAHNLPPPWLSPQARCSSAPRCTWT